MMKKFIMAMMLVVAASSFGYVYLDEGFETGTLDNVTVIDNDGDTNNWQITASPGKTGAYYAESVSAGLTPDNTMEFPYTWAEKDAYLKFKVGAGDQTNFAEHFSVLVCLPDFNPELWVTVYEETLVSSDWKEINISLSEYLKQIDEYFWDGTVSIRIRHFDSDNQGSLLLDDMMLYYFPTFNYDSPSELAQSAIEPYMPMHFVWDFWDRSSYDADWNYVGWNNIPKMYYILSDKNGVQPVQEIELTPNLESDSWWTYYCDLPGMPMGTFIEYWCEAVDNTPYAITGVSNHLFAEWGEINFGEGFESGVLSEGWLSYQTGEVVSSFDYAWTIGASSKQNVHSGEYSIKSESQSNFGVWETSNYLVTPRLRVNGTPTLKYFVNAETVPGYEFRERWSVLISTVEGDGTDIENFVEIQRDSIIPTEDNLDEWFEKTFYLGDYQDQYVRIMWKHLYTSTAAKLDRFLILDDISIAEMPILEVEDAGNGFIPGEDVVINATATDYSGIDNVTIYYTIEGQPEATVVMTDNGDDTFTGVIPGQTPNTKCSWYVVVTDGSAFSNTATSASNDLIWFESGILEWGSDYSDWPEPMNSGDKAGIDWNFGTKGSLYVNKIEVGLSYDAPNLKWRLVEFDGVPTENVIGDLEGTHSFVAGGDSYDIGGFNTSIYGHVALIFDFDQSNEILLDESGDKSHAWQWNSVSNWSTNLWGAFYVKMYAQTGIENEFVSSTTELCQNYPNPFNPTTNISFYNRIAGDVSLTVYNTKGEKVAVLINEKMNEGFRKVELNASKLNSGVYYYTLRSPEKTLTKKMVLVK